MISGAKDNEKEEEDEKPKGNGLPEEDWNWNWICEYAILMGRNKLMGMTIKNSIAA